MIVTKDEAKELLCPMVRVPHDISSLNTHNRCISENCMLWEWADEEIERGLVPEYSGYCGLVKR